MPMIAIPSCRKLEDYKQSILHVGGEVRIVDASMPIEDALAGVDGLLLTGGDDIAPARYGEDPHPTLVEAEPGRDEFEIALTRAARDRHLPIFAICRGIQVLNVAFGGTLVQDIPSQIPGALTHTLKVPPNEPYTLAHEVWLEKGSLLSTLMGERLSDGDACEVNSRHHQAVKAVASGFKVSATAPDGVIEAIEDPAAEFCLGVQWHPENFWRTGEFRPLFEGFIAAAKSATR
jgi:gamma-glutamyl-gamma-aminobutyrate hydrolase PuuD